MTVESSSKIHHAVRVGRDSGGSGGTACDRRPGVNKPSSAGDPKFLTWVNDVQYISVHLPTRAAKPRCPQHFPTVPPLPPLLNPDEREFLAAMGRQVRESRERRGLARKAMSQSAGVSERYLAQLEAGEGNASVLLLRSVARALETPLAELVDPRESSVERRLIRRFLDRLPAHRLEDAVFRLMRDYGEEAAARHRRIALVGLRGAGKTTLGSALAAELDTPFVELDREIEREAGISLSEIFLLYGQAGYRRIERRCLERLLAGRRRW